MDDIKISKAKWEDFSYIQEKIKKYLLDGSNIDWWQFFILRIADQTVAFGRIIDHGDFFEIASLGVDYCHRKNGLGKKMLSYLAQEAGRKDRRKPIYGVTHVPGFAAACGFVRVEDNYPDYLDYKCKHICHLGESKISIVKWRGCLT